MHFIWFHFPFRMLLKWQKGFLNPVNPNQILAQWMDIFRIPHPVQIFNLKSHPISGADPGFFLGGGALVSCSTSTPINHIVFFFCRIPVVLENRRSSQGGGGAHPLHPPPRSAPAYYFEIQIPAFKWMHFKSYNLENLEDSCIE